MASVEVLSADKIHSMVDTALNSAVIDGSNHLVFTTVEGDTIDLGNLLAAIANASTTVLGLVQLATNTETTTGTNTTKATTPAGVTAAIAVLASSITTALALKQPLDSDLTTIAGLTATTGNMLLAVGSAWASATPTTVKTALAIAESDVTGLVASLANLQPLDSDLTTIAGLTATTNNFMVSVGSAWASRTPAQAKVTLAIVMADISDLAAALALKATLAAPTFTGLVTFSDATVNAPTALVVSSAHVATDASSGNLFDVACSGAFTLDAPSNPTNGQVIHYRFTQDATGGRVMTLASAFDSGPNTITLSTGANKVDHMVAQYRSAASKWDITGFLAGF